jgi:outer membrane protein assembly factor BamB
MIQTRTLGVISLFIGTVLTNAADQSQWGSAWTRNMVSDERGLPSDFDPASGRSIKWTAALGTETHSTPVIAGGRVYIGTNNEVPRDPKHIGDRGVLMCFDEKDGKFLWQLVAPKRVEDPFFDWPKTGMSSPVTVEGDRVYVVSNRGEVLCLDANGFANGNDGPFTEEAAATVLPGEKPVPSGPTDADIIWKFDLTAGAGIWSHDGAHSSIVIRGDQLYLNSGTGVDNSHVKIRAPDAPSLVVLDKETGRLLARDGEKIAPKIFHCTWSAPSLATVGGRETVFFAGGNGVVYAFEPLKETPPEGEVRTLQKRWEFDFDPNAPKEDVHRFTRNRTVGPSNIYGMPVVVDGHLYVTGGGDLWWGKNEAWLKCVDAKNGQLIWAYPLGKHAMTTPALRDGLVFVADAARTVHCVDAATGKPFWTHEAKGEFWSSPLIADGKVYIGSRRGDFLVFAAEREKKVLANIDLGSPMSATPVAANGTVYVATMKQLFAISANR